MDADLYDQFVEFSESVYIPVSALFSTFAAKTVTEQRIPFDVAVDPFYSVANQRHLISSIEQLESGKGTAHELIED